MKRYLFLLLLSFSLLGVQSCNTVSRTFSKSEQKKDSLAVTQSSKADVKKEDSTGQSKTITETKTAGQNTYTKKTTVKEYYAEGDELDIDYDVDTVYVTAKMKVDSTRKKKASENRLKYRETTIVETGIAHQSTQGKTISTQQSDLKKVDSTRQEKGGSTHVTEAKNESAGTTKKKSFLWGAGVVILAGLALWLIFFRKKKDN